MRVADRDGFVPYRMLPASTVTGGEVVNRQRESLGRIHDLVVDTKAGHVAYAVLAAGGFAGLGNRLFAMPWSAFDVTGAENRLIVDVARNRLKAPGFEKYKQWPNFADSEWGGTIHDYYGCVPYWKR